MGDLISIIVPIYNEEKYLERCINSILEQTHKNLQLILVNDGSEDKSLEICNHYKSIDDRILVVNKENRGVSAARNCGIKLAKGDFIGFIDSDDYIEKDMYEILLNKIKKDNSHACVLTLATINSFEEYKSDYKNNIINKEEALKHLFLLSFPVSLCAYLYRREILKDIYLNEEIHFFEDFEFNFNILNKMEKVSLCHDKLYNYMINEGSINRQEINEKRITCLHIYKDIIKTVKDQNSNIIKYCMYFRSHFLSSIIINVVKSNKVEQKYFDIIRKESKYMLIDIIYSRYVPLKYKAAILVCALNPKILYYLMSFKRY